VFVRFTWELSCFHLQWNKIHQFLYINKRKQVYFRVITVTFQLTRHEWVKTDVVKGLMLNKLSDMAVIVYVYQTVTVEQAASAGTMVVCLR